MTGVVLISHLDQISGGIEKLLEEFNLSVPITFAKTKNKMGTTFDSVLVAIKENAADNILVFYDLGSSKINAQLAKDLYSKKRIEIMNNAMIEGAILAVHLIGPKNDFETVVSKLREEELKSKI